MNPGNGLKDEMWWVAKIKMYRAVGVVSIETIALDKDILDGMGNMAPCVPRERTHSDRPWKLRGDE